MKKKEETNENEKIELSMHLLQVLLPYLRLLDEEQMIENETEAKIRGIFYPLGLLIEVINMWIDVSL